MIGFQQRNVTVMGQDGRNWAVVEPITYIAANGNTYVVPRGARTDGCSTPKEIWPFLPPFGDYWLAAVLHDAGYQNTLLVENEQGTALQTANLTKEQCDNLFKEAMQTLGVNEATVDKIYWGVSVGGWKAFKTDRT
jgi:hypothetical protein